ncbi:MAG: bifunctional riboflavin kinase/FAD synthetase [Alphaproteobacteria bacterium]
MRIFRHISGLKDEDRGAVVAIGNFDGVHRGHRTVIDAAGAIARETGALQGVLTFEPHPRSVFQPDIAPFRLTPFRGKARQIELLGADILYVLQFDQDFSARSAEDFVRLVLLEGTGVSHVVAGADFVFGNRRRGTGALLREMGGKHGFGVTLVEPVAGRDGLAYSSTRIRELLASGRPGEAARILGRYWEIEGRVEAGDKRGREIGFPTANITLEDYLRPAAGVYAVRAGLDEPEAGGEAQTVWRDGVANIGRRPTFGGDDLILEVNLFDFEGDLYGRHLRVSLIEHLRPEKKFDGIASLKAQIAEDAALARGILATRDPAPAAGDKVEP